MYSEEKRWSGYRDMICSCRKRFGGGRETAWGADARRSVAVVDLSLHASQLGGEDAEAVAPFEQPLVDGSAVAHRLDAVLLIREAGESDLLEQGKSASKAKTK